MAIFCKPKLFTPAVGARGMTELHFAAYSGALGARTSDDPVHGGGSDE